MAGSSGTRAESRAARSANPPPILSAHVLPPITDAENAAGLARADSLASGFGITTMFSARTDEGQLRVLSAADRAGTLTVRVVAALRGRPAPAATP